MVMFTPWLRSTSTSTSTLYNAPSTVTTMHRCEQTIYLQLINNKKSKKSNVFTYIK